MTVIASADGSATVTPHDGVRSSYRLPGVVVRPLLAFFDSDPSEREIVDHPPRTNAPSVRTEHFVAPCGSAVTKSTLRVTVRTVGEFRNNASITLADATAISEAFERTPA